MHLITFDDGNGERIGLLEGVGGDVVDLPAVDPELPRAMLGLIELGEAGLRRVRAAWEAAGPDPRRYHRDRNAPAGWGGLRSAALFARRRPGGRACGWHRRPDESRDLTAIESKRRRAIS